MVDCYLKGKLNTLLYVLLQNIFVQRCVNIRTHCHKLLQKPETKAAPETNYRRVYRV